MNSSQFMNFILGISNTYCLRWKIVILFLCEFQVHKIIGFSPILLQAIMSDQLDMPVRQAGKFPSPLPLVDSMGVACFYLNLIVISSVEFLVF